MNPEMKPVPIVLTQRGLDVVISPFAGHHWNCSSRKLVKGLQTGQYVSDERSPLGINEEGKYSIVSRYYKMKQTNTLSSPAYLGSGNRHPHVTSSTETLECGVRLCAIDMKCWVTEFAAKWRRGRMRTDAPSLLQQQQELRHS